MRARLSDSALVWIAMLAPPIAWVIQFILSYGSRLASCYQAGSQWGIPVDGLTIATTAAAGAIAVAAVLAAVRLRRATADAGTEPPAARIHFLATIAVVVATMSLFLTLLQGLGELSLSGCVQA